MTTETFFDCENISEIKTVDGEVKGYRVTKESMYPDDHVHCDYFISKVFQFKDGKSGKTKSTGRDNISNVIKSGSAVTEFTMELFCNDGIEDKCFHKFTKESE